MEPTATKGERTARRILDAAEELFARAGYEGTSLRDIAARAHIQQPGIYNHFQSKEALYRAVLERGLQPLLTLMEQTADRGIGKSGVIDLAGPMSDLLGEHPNISGLLVRAMQATDHKGADITFEWLERLLEKGRSLLQAAGTPRSGDELILYQVALFNLCCGYFWAAPLIERVTGKPVTSQALIAIQKRLLAEIGTGTRSVKGGAPR